jgi:uncharacterized protein (TIGR00288 family)
LGDAPNAALLIDFDNVTLGIRSDLQNQLRKLLNSDIIKGKVSVQRAYADWRRYPQYIVPLSEASIDLIFAPAFGANKKNATDIRLAIDALELVFIRPEIGTFILLSGDSDFSALVLKLKEYGKFVIGVGIRESASDLLVQNCDEYYSYNELTGLAKEREVEHVRKDPWQLVVEAVQRMQRDGDVMRSDRLKQVMQTLDPNFDERDAGYNRFSKFVVAAGQRGLVKLAKMDNGQYAIEIGANANVPHAQEPVSVPQVGGDRASDDKSRLRGPRRAAEAAAAPSLTLSESFELLRQTLVALGAVGAESTDADRARDKLTELSGNKAEPAFEPKRFLRMLRQAHDAGIIDLIKRDDEGYQLRLAPVAEAVGVPEPGTDAVDVVAESESQEPVTEIVETKKPARRARATTRKSAKSRAKKKDAPESGEAVAGGEVAVKSEKQGEEAAKPPRRKTVPRTTGLRVSKDEPKGDEGAAELASHEGAATGKSVADEAPSPAKRSTRRPRTATKRSPRSKARTSAKNGELAEPSPRQSGSQHDSTASVVASTEVGTTPRRNPRFRRGSRGAAPRPPVAETQDDKQDVPSVTLSTASAVTRQEAKGRTLGVRKGSRGRRTTDTGSPRPEPVQEQMPSQPLEHGSPTATVAPSPPLGAAVPPSASSGDAMSDGSSAEGRGFLKRITTALQRAMQGSEPGEDEDSDR